MLKVNHKNYLTLLLFIAIALFSVGAFFASKVAASDTVDSCRDLAAQVLKEADSKYAFSRCELEQYMADNGSSLTRVYVVAGDIDRKWEFECGYMAPCETHVGWVDKEGLLVEFTDPPQTANEDPSVYTMGCGQKDVDSVFDTQVNPELTFKDGKYWWKINYSDMKVYSNSLSSDATLAPLCLLNGSSMVGADEVVSDVHVAYSFDDGLCQTNERPLCLTRKALTVGSIDACFEARFNAEKAFDNECLSNYIAQTGDTASCRLSTLYSSHINCNHVPKIKQKNGGD